MALGLKNWDRHCCEGLGGGTRRWLSSETSNCPLGVTGTLWPLISVLVVNNGEQLIGSKFCGFAFVLPQWLLLLHIILLSVGKHSHSAAAPALKHLLCLFPASSSCILHLCLYFCGQTRDAKSWRYWRYISASFVAGANFWAILGNFWAILAILGHFWAILGHFG